MVFSANNKKWGRPSTTVISENWTAFGEVVYHLESPANPVVTLVHLEKIMEQNFRYKQTKKQCKIKIGNEIWPSDLSRVISKKIVPRFSLNMINRKKVIYFDYKTKNFFFTGSPVDVFTLRSSQKAKYGDCLNITSAPRRPFGWHPVYGVL